MARKDATKKPNTKKSSVSVIANAKNEANVATRSLKTQSQLGEPFLAQITRPISATYSQYVKDLKGSSRLRLIDTFLAFLVAVGVVQFGFCVFGGSFPFNAFLSGFGATVGQFVLTVALRLQSAESNKQLFKGLLPERAFGEYIFASLLLHFVLIHFIN